MNNHQPAMTALSQQFCRTLSTLPHLVAAARLALGREASPSAGIIDSQSAKTTDAAGLRVYDAGKKIKGRKRHIITDTEGHLVGLRVHAADIQDRDGAVVVTASIRQLYPWPRHLFADGGYAGEKLTQALADLGTWTIEIIKRSDTAGRNRDNASTGLADFRKINGLSFGSRKKR